MRGSKKRWLWLAAAPLLGLSTAAYFFHGAPPSKPFTRESVLEQHRDRYPEIRLPPDTLPATVTASEDVAYAHVSGKPLELDVYRPRAGGLLPAVLVVHGGGWKRGDRRMERPFAKQLAALGYVTATVSYRLGPEGRFPNALHDLKAAVRFLRHNAARFELDPEKIGALGASAGGQLVALLGASNGLPRLEGAVGELRSSSEVQAVVCIDGLADFAGPALVEQQNRSPGASVEFLGGPYAERAATWREASALTHVGPKSAPTLFVNSTAETPILPGRPEMCRRLTALHKECSIVTLPNTPHPFWLVEPWFTVTLRESDAFLRKHLGR